MFGHRFFGARYFGPRYWGDGGDIAPPEPVLDVVPTLGGWKSKYDKKRKPRVLRYSDFATREEFQAAVQEAIPIPRPKVVDSAEDLEDEDFIIMNLLHLLDD